jgi:bifunctional DNase/RNase
MKLQSQAPPRPMTHDLVTDMLEQLGAQVTRITVTELRENTFYAQITMQLDGAEIEIDSRPSDAIALAIRAEAPIFAADRVIEESAIEFEGDEVNEEQLEAEVTKFKAFLDEVTPDQFAEGDEEDEAEDPETL